MKKTINQLIAECIDYTLYIGVMFDENERKRLEKKSEELRKKNDRK